MNEKKHEWKETYHVDFDPFDQTTFPLFLSVGVFIINQMIP